jgi:hypothetical protein
VWSPRWIDRISEIPHVKASFPHTDTLATHDTHDTRQFAERM